MNKCFDFVHVYYYQILEYPEIYTFELGGHHSQHSKINPNIVIHCKNAKIATLIIWNKYDAGDYLEL